MPNLKFYFFLKFEATTILTQGVIEQGIMQLLDNPYIGKARPEIKKI